MATIKDFEDLECWKKAREITRQIYRFTKQGEFARDFELLKQIRRSAVSVMSNVAEGFERDGNREFINFLSIAKGSVGEVRAQLYVALDQGYISDEEFRFLKGLVRENGRLIAGLMRFLRSSDIKGIKFK